MFKSRKSHPQTTSSLEGTASNNANTSENNALNSLKSGTHNNAFISNRFSTSSELDKVNEVKETIQQNVSMHKVLLYRGYEYNFKNASIHSVHFHSTNSASSEKDEVSTGDAPLKENASLTSDISSANNISSENDELSANEENVQNDTIHDNYGNIKDDTNNKNDVTINDEGAPKEENDQQEDATHKEVDNENESVLPDAEHVNAESSTQDGNATEHSSEKVNSSDKEIAREDDCNEKDDDTSSKVISDDDLTATVVVHFSKMHIRYEDGTPIEEGIAPKQELEFEYRFSDHSLISPDNSRWAVYGYKVLTADMHSLNGKMQYEPGKTYKTTETPVLQQAGFHFFMKPSQIVKYGYTFKGARVFQVRAAQQCVTDDTGELFSTNEITCVRELDTDILKRVEKQESVFKVLSTILLAAIIICSFILGDDIAKGVMNFGNKYCFLRNLQGWTGVPWRQYFVMLLCFAFVDIILLWVHRQIEWSMDGNMEYLDQYYAYKYDNG